MKFSITSFQLDPKHLFQISHKAESRISEVISNRLSNLEPGYDLVFSISCYSNNPNELIFKELLDDRTIQKEITQFLSFPFNNLEYHDDWILDTKTFDFKKKKNAYKAYPLDKYVSLVVDSLYKFFMDENLDTGINFEKVKQELVHHFDSNKVMYRFMNEELITLQELIRETHYSYTLECEKDWQQSEIGQKWLVLKEKYSFADDGSLIEN